MKVYLNHPRYALIIPCEVLTAMGYPRYIQILEKKQDKTLFVRSVGYDAENSYDIVDGLYQTGAALGIVAENFGGMLRCRMGWNNGTYAVEAKIVLSGDSGEAAGIFLDLKTAVAEEYRPPHGHMLPGCQMRESEAIDALEFAEEDDGMDEDGEDEQSWMDS